MLEIEELVEMESRLLRGFEVEPAEERPSMEVDFSPRGIDLTHFPYNAWRKVTRNTLVDDNKEVFLAGSPQGELEMNICLCCFLRFWEKPMRGI